MMSDARFQELIEDATARIDPGDVVERLDRMLRMLVKCTGWPGEKSLEAICALLKSEDDANAK